MKYTWSTPLRERILKRLHEMNTGHGPTIKDYCTACNEEDVSMTYWHQRFADFIAWLIDEKDVSKGSMAASLVSSACYDWRQLHEITVATAGAFGLLSRYRPPNSDQAFIDPDAIEKPEE